MQQLPPVLALTVERASPTSIPHRCHSLQPLPQHRHPLQHILLAPVVKAAPELAVSAQLNILCPDSTRCLDQLLSAALMSLQLLADCNHGGVPEGRVQVWGLLGLAAAAWAA